MAKKKTLEQLQEDHSEMLATAADLGVTVPEDLTVDFATAEVGTTVCSNLDALIRNFRAGVDEKDEDQGGDDDFEEVDEVHDEDIEDEADANEDENKGLASDDESGNGEDEGKKSGGGKRSHPKKSTTNKTRAAAQVAEVETDGEQDVTDNVKNDAAKAKAAAAKEKEKAKAAATKEKEKAAAAKAKEKAAKEKTKAKEAAAKEKAKAAAAKAKEKGAKVKVAKANGGTRTRLDENATINWGGKDNPARDGAGRHERIAQVIKFSGKTVKAYLAAGGNPTTLRNCMNAKLCTVA